MISVIVPFYCTKKEYFDKCMKSILYDDNADIEVLVIDDGSPENYRVVTDSYTVDERVQVLHIEHSGVSVARNIGIDRAKGEWITFVDSDDYVEHNTMSVLSVATKESSADLIYYNGYGDKAGKVEENHFFLCEDVDYAAEQDYKSLVLASALSLGYFPKGYKHYFSLGGVCCKLIKRKLLERYQIRFNPEIHFAEDTLFSLELIQKAEHIKYIDKYLYHYNINSDSVTNKYRIGLSKDMDAFFEAVWELIGSYGLKGKLSDSYYLRAYIELQRCIRKEFYHKENPMKIVEKNKVTRQFLKKEPYHTALRLRDVNGNDLKYMVISFLLKHDLIYTYYIMYKLLKR